MLGHGPEEVKAHCLQAHEADQRGKSSNRARGGHDLISINTEEKE